jgi:CubicO group peptidase (beta-lactamase class C family)
MGSRIDGSAIDKVLEEAVGTGAVPHVAAIAADRDGVVYEGGAGVRVAGESDDPVTTATQFRIMSMTKMVCTTAALQQVERGELDLDAPVDTYVPAFADLQVLDGFDDTDTPRLRAPASRATVQHLMTHTAGLAYWF